MLSISKRARKGKRFNLLLLEEKEHYLEDAAAFLHVLPDDGALVSFGQRTKLKGRLHICSKSLVFEADDPRHPIQRLPLKDIVALKLKSAQDGTGTDYIAISTTMVIEIQQNTPYVFRTLSASEPSCEFCFSLSYVSLPDQLAMIKTLYAIDREPVKTRVVSLRKFIEDRESKIEFDTSWYVDIGEKPLLRTAQRCSQVSPLVVCAGCLMVTNEVVYFQPFNQVTAEAVYRYKISDIKRLYKRRHMMREVGLEIYLSQKKKTSQAGDELSPGKERNDSMGSMVQDLLQESAYFSFPSPEVRDQIYNLIVGQESYCPQLQHGLAHMTELWRSKQISNFEYLLFINEEAGRSFQDLTQYPVFPWVLQDFTSPQLDLDNPATFRDLSQPIGALDAKRLDLFKQRMVDMPEDIHKGHPFLYGTHYSTPGYVLYYLVRRAPEYMLRLQNGKFDHPDRLFTSVGATWDSCLHSTTDVKELIPEFYHAEDPACGEFLANDIGLDLGVRQNGKEVEDVELPRWAKSPRDFVQKCRKALECPYVADRLHHWIDLVFGYKQKGPAAQEANNLFYYLTYEGAVDVESITDPVERASLEAQISEFGQTPRQIFTEPHIQRGAPAAKPRTLISPSPQIKSGSTTTSSSTSTSTKQPSPKKIVSVKKILINKSTTIAKSSSSPNANPSPSPNPSPNPSPSLSSTKSGSPGSTKGTSPTTKTTTTEGSPKKTSTKKVKRIVKRLVPKKGAKAQASSSTKPTEDGDGSSEDEQPAEVIPTLTPSPVVPVVLDTNALLGNSSSLPQAGSHPNNNDIALWKEVENIEVKQLDLDLPLGDLSLQVLVGGLPLSHPTQSSSSSSGSSGSNGQNPLSSWGSGKDKDNDSWLAGFTDLECTQKINIHRDAMTAVALSLDQQTLCSASADGTLKIYSIPEKKQRRSTKLCDMALSSLCLTPDAQTVLVGSWSNNIYLYSVGYGQALCSLPGHDDAVSKICLHNNTILSSSWDATVKVWSMRESEINRNPVSDLSDHEAAVTCLDYNPKHQVAVSGSRDGSLILWDIRNGQQIRTIEAHKGALVDVCFASDGGEVISTSSDGDIKRFETSSGEELSSVTAGEVVRKVQSNQSYLLSAGDSGTLRLWDLLSDTVLCTLPGECGPIACVDLSKDAGTLVCGSTAKADNLRVWQSSMRMLGLPRSL